MNEERAYEQVASEMSANNLRPGLMAKAYAESAGNTNVAKSLYIKYRAKQIIEKDIADQEAAMARAIADQASILSRARADQAKREKIEANEKAQILAKQKAEKKLRRYTQLERGSFILERIVLAIGKLIIIIPCILGLVIFFIIGFAIILQSKSLLGSKFFDLLLGVCSIGLSVLFGWGLKKGFYLK